MDKLPLSGLASRDNFRIARHSFHIYFLPLKRFLRPAIVNGIS